MNCDQKSATAILCADNIECLQRLDALLERISDTQYVQSAAPCDSGIGAHVRHILDHYDVLLTALDSGHIDYDRRARDRKTQVQRDTARRRIAGYVTALRQLSDTPPAAPLRVTMDCGSSDSTGCEAPSSLARELQFLVSHTVHHDALIAAAARQMRIEIDDGFGVAPSTLRFDECGGRP